MQNNINSILKKIIPIVEWVKHHYKLTLSIFMGLIVVSVLLVNALSFSLESETKHYEKSMVPGEEVMIDRQAIEQGDAPQEYELVTQNGLTMSIDLLTTNIILEDQDDFRFETLNVDETLNASAQRAQQSPFSLIYMYEGWEVGKRLDAYNHAVADDNYTIETISNGVRIHYNLTITTPSLTWMPQRIDEALYDQLHSMTDQTGKIALSQIYSRASGATNYSIVSSAPQAAIDRIYDLWYEEYGLDYDELFALNEAFNIRNRFIEKPDFTIPVEYTLEDGDLKVRVLSHAIKEESLEFEEGRSLFITELDLHSGLHSRPIEEDSFIFVPDGSGAIINLDEPQTYYTRYQKSIYDNRSHLSSELKNMDFQHTINLPIFGIASQDTSVLGIIESGAEQTRLQVRRASSLSGYNAVYPTIQYRYRDMHSVISGVEIDIYSELLNDQEYIVRYKIIDNDNTPSYMDFVDLYRDYLFNDSNENPIVPSIHLELIGAFNKKEHFLGIPYNSVVALTTYQQAKTLMEYFDENIESSLRYSYLGAFEGGLHHDFPTKISHEDELGSSDEFNALQTYSDNPLYFGLDFINVYQNRNNGFVNRTHGMRLIGDHTLEYFPYANNTLLMDNASDGSFYRLSPKYLNSSITRFIEQNELNTPNIGLKDIGNTFIADFGRTPVSPSAAFDMVDNSLNEVTSRYNVLLNNPFIRYVNAGSTLENIPHKSSQEKIFDYDIPFMQLVLQGHVAFSLSSMNLSNIENDIALMKAIETNSALKYSITAENSQITKDSDVFSYLYNTDYRNLQNTIVNHDNTLTQHLDSINDPFIVNHQVINEHVTFIEYRSGETVWFNYSKNQTYTIDGEDILPLTFVLKEDE